MMLRGAEDVKHEQVPLTPEEEDPAVVHPRVVVMLGCDTGAIEVAGPRQRACLPDALISVVDHNRVVGARRDEEVTDGIGVCEGSTRVDDEIVATPVEFKSQSVTVDMRRLQGSQSKGHVEGIGRGWRGVRDAPKDCKARSRRDEAATRNRP